MSQYGKPRKPVHWSSVHCTGTEQQILSCDHNEFSVEEKKAILVHIDVAGIKCQTTASIAPTTTDETSDENGSDSSSMQASAVLVGPAHLTMLMVIVNLALSIL